MASVATPPPSLPCTTTDPLSRAALRLARLQASPGTMATEISRGKWRAYLHHRLIDVELVKLTTRQVPERILLIEVPPGHGKSEMVSRWLPSWHVANFPDKLVGLFSYGDQFAKQWGRKARQSFLEAAGEFDLRIDRRRDAANEWGPLGREGGMLTAGFGGGWTGRRLHLMIGDDPIKSDKEAMSQNFRDGMWDWWESTCDTRLEPEGVIVVIHTRWHIDDLIGRAKRHAEEGTGPPVRVVRLPALAEADDPLGRPEGEALWPERWSTAHLADVKRTKGVYWWNALYQQKPTQHEATEWPDEYFRDIWYDDEPAVDEVACKVLSLDPSLGATEKSDFAAFVKLTITHDGSVWADADLGRRDLTTLAGMGLDHYRHFAPDVWALEINGFRALDDLVHRMADERRVVGLRFATVTQHANKIARIRLGVGPVLAYHRIRFKRGSPGSELLVQQLKDFPLGDKLDGPDALETALRVADELIASGGLPSGVSDAPRRIVA